MIQKQRRLYLAAVLIFSTFVGQASAQSTQQASEPSHAQQVLLPFKQELQGTLLAGMQQGVAEAVTACKLEAHQIAESNSTDGIFIGRTSHKLRNPDNVSPDWVEPIMNIYLQSEDGIEPKTVPLKDGRVGYVEPIYVQPLCIACHGDVLVDDVSVRISELYPEDSATGFSIGDFRGVFWVELPAEN